jgi:hypothetical protein
MLPQDFVPDRSSADAPARPHHPRARLRAASAARLVAGLLLTAACSGDADVTAPPSLTEATPRTAVSTLPALIEEPVELTAPTYENSGESVHPDVVEFPLEWNGWRYWLTMTPYPRSDFHVENPSILVSGDGLHLQVPQGLVNPVVAHHGRPSDYNSDPELVYNPETNRLLMFYRFVDKRTNTIRVSSTVDGRTWREEPKAFWARLHQAVSPTVALKSGENPTRMWYVDAGKAGCKAQSSRVMMRSLAERSGRITDERWLEPVATDLAQPGYVVWHMKVRYVPSKNEYWALYAAFPTTPAGCDVDDLFFARSADGVHWTTYPAPILRHEDRAWTAAAIYRSSFLYDADSDELRVWLSARGADAKWRLGFAHFRYSRLLQQLSTSTAPERTAAARMAIGHSEDEH